MKSRFGSRSILLAGLIGCVGNSSSNPSSGVSTPPLMSEGAKTYLADALDTLERVTVRADTVAWSHVRDTALILAAGAQRPVDTYAAIEWAMRRANKHSFLQAEEIGASSAMIQNRFAYIHIPHRNGTGIPLADSLHTAVRLLTARNPCGWIIDLRANGGGNMWPMLAGIGPLLGDTIVGSFGGRADSDRWFYKNGISGTVSPSGKIDAMARVTVVPLVTRDSTTPLAVLIDSETGSSGEAVAIAFLARPHTRTFGTPSAGYATWNRGATLSDGANMVVTAGYDADRRGRVYVDRILPDTVVGVPAGWPSATDLVSRAAVTWLATRSACTS